MPMSNLYKAPDRSLLGLAAAPTACGDVGSGEGGTSNLPTLPATDATGPGPGTTQDLPTGDEIVVVSTSAPATARRPRSRGVPARTSVIGRSLKMSTNTRALLCTPLLLSLACGDDGGMTDPATTTVTLPMTISDSAPMGSTGPGEPTGGSTSVGGTGGATGTTSETPPTSTTMIGETATGSGGSTTTPAETDGSSSDVSASSDGGESSTTEPIDKCKVNDDMDADVPCTDEAPPNSFEPDLQWVWMGQDGENQIAVTPVVANLTDDNGDGEIDLCDVPDIVVPAYQSSYWTGSLYVFDGATGAVHYKVADVGALTYPAIADIDNDGLPEILTARSMGGASTGVLMALEHDGTLKWTSPTVYEVGSSAIAVADIDHDGDVEIVHHGYVFDHNGALLWQAFNMQAYVNTIADLDGDDNMEVILGPTAYRHDGSMYYSVASGDGHPQVADLDGDGQPEVLVVANSGLALIEHDGTLTYANQQNGLARWQPASIHDFDGDMLPEFAVSSGNKYSVFETNLQPKWTVNIQDGSGYASSTAFDFLGDGTAEAMYADEVNLFIFDGTGQPLLTSPRSSWTQWEMPIVADVDNDASAEIVVVSNGGSPPLQVVRDKMDRWIPARRIWNQHTYHVTNVREDATIPQFEPKSWKTLNTFRTQAQIANGGVCLPEPQ